MKYFALLHILFFALSACRTAKEELTTNPDLPPPFNGPGVTREQVVAIATKYGFQDSIAPGYKATRFIAPSEEAYPFLSEEFYEHLFANWRKGLDSWERIQLRRRTIAAMQTLEEYLAYAKQHPDELKMWDRLPEDEREALGWEAFACTEVYEDFREEVLAGRILVYVSDEGTVTTTDSPIESPTFKGRLLRRGN
jgi:hypothetical protein